MSAVCICSKDSLKDKQTKKRDSESKLLTGSVLKSTSCDFSALLNTNSWCSSQWVQRCLFAIEVFFCSAVNQEQRCSIQQATVVNLTAEPRVAVSAGSSRLEAPMRRTIAGGNEEELTNSTAGHKPNCAPLMAGIGPQAEATGPGSAHAARAHPGGN